MSIMIDLPPAMAKEASGYAMLEGTTLEAMFMDCLTQELKRKRGAKVVLDRLDSLVAKTSPRLSGAPYKFNRADAYPEDSCE